MKINSTQSSGFSILIAIGTIGVLLIIVSSLAITYIRESKLSRLSYDEVISSVAAEGAFEYGMLKIRNHRDGFQDTVTGIEPDGNLLQLTTSRSSGLQSGYSIIASSTGHIFDIEPTQHLIIPLFTSNDGMITPGGQSRNPGYHTGVKNTTNLSISDIGSLSWSIIAMSGSETIAITGTGDINTSKEGIIRHRKTQCYDQGTGSGKLCDLFVSGDEEIVYFYDESELISDFLARTTDPYFILQNTESNPISVNISATEPFALPTVTFRSTARKGESSKIFEFTEDKGKYYDAFKYGIYNKN